MKRFELALAGLLLAGVALADATLPKADIAGAKDSPLIGRFAGSFIVSPTTRARQGPRRRRGR